MMRMATNGRRNTAAISHALNAGAHTPISGDNASPTPADVPFNPETSAYVWTAAMNETPMRGPIKKSSSHQARDTSNSRHSFRNSQSSGESGERKKHLFEA